MDETEWFSTVFLAFVILQSKLTQIPKKWPRIYATAGTVYFLVGKYPHRIFLFPQTGRPTLFALTNKFNEICSNFLIHAMSPQN